jgi:hypothetical protein
VLERLEQLVEFGLTDRALPGHKAGVFNLLAGWKTAPDNQRLAVDQIGPVEVGIGYAEPVADVRPIADVPDFQLVAARPDATFRPISK